MHSTIHLRANFIKSIYEIGWFSGGAIFSKSEAYLTNCFFNRDFVNGETFDCWSELKGGQFVF